MGGVGLGWGEDGEGGAGAGGGVPAQSLYPDGRYAHLWRTYRPQAVIEQAAKTDQEKLLDIVEGFKERRAQIGRAALENCAVEQLAIQDCFRYGGWRTRVTMCRDETRTFERCYVTQAVREMFLFPFFGLIFIFFYLRFSSFVFYLPSITFPSFTVFSPQLNEIFALSSSSLNL